MTRQSGLLLAEAEAGVVAAAEQPGHCGLLQSVLPSILDTVVEWARWIFEPLHAVE